MQHTSYNDCRTSEWRAANATRVIQRLPHIEVAGGTSACTKMPLQHSTQARDLGAMGGGRTCPSVMYPVRSGIGCVMSSLGIVKIGNCIGTKTSMPKMTARAGKGACQALSGTM